MNNADPRFLDMRARMNEGQITDPQPWDHDDTPCAWCRVTAFLMASFFVVCLVLGAAFAERVWTNHNAERLEQEQ